MRVKRITNTQVSYQSRRTNLGKEYIVYGMITENNIPWFYVCEYPDDNFPIANPGNLFEVIDHRISRYWIYGDQEMYPTWMFPEWITEPYFANNLTDYEEREMKIFQVYKEAMDFEFPDPSISMVAQIGDENWLICPICIDAWESKTTIDGMVRCPKCKNVMHNPRYNEGFRTKDLKTFD